MHKVLLAMTEQLVRKVQQDFKVLRVTLVQPASSGLPEVLALRALQGRQARKGQQVYKESQVMLVPQVQPALLEALAQQEQ